MLHQPVTGTRCLRCHCSSHHTGYSFMPSNLQLQWVLKPLHLSRQVDWLQERQALLEPCCPAGTCNKDAHMPIPLCGTSLLPECTLEAKLQYHQRLVACRRAGTCTKDTYALPAPQAPACPSGSTLTARGQCFYDCPASGYQLVRGISDKCIETCAGVPQGDFCNSCAAGSAMTRTGCLAP